MKQEIACDRCAADWRRIAEEPEVVVAGERVVVDAGTAKGNFFCDGCNAPLSAGEKCHAVTVTTREQTPDSAWAHDYIEVSEAEEG